MAECELWVIGLKFLPAEDMNALADLLDPPNGPISMETFAQKLDQLYHYRLRLISPLLTAIRHRNGYGRPTKILISEYLQPRGVSIGEIKYVLDNMQAATRNIFDITRILGMYNASLRSQSGSTPSQHPCHCSQCYSIGLPDERLHATEQLPGSPSRLNLPPHQTHRRMDYDRRFECAESESQLGPSSRSRDWFPPESECCCGRPTCQQCEERRLTDPEETIVLSVDQREQCASVRLNQLNQSASRLSNRTPNEHRNIDGDELVHALSYTENTMNSVDLRGSPEGNSYMFQSRHSENHDAAMKGQCTCSKSVASACTCKCIKRSQSQHSQQCISSKSDDKSNRWSTESAPLIGRNGSEDMFDHGSDIHQSGDSSCSQHTIYSRQSIKSVSDGDISYPSYNPQRDHQSGNRILISYTDDVKDDVVCLAQDLKEDGFEVSADMHRNTYFKAKNKGVVTENDQYAWLRNKYSQANHIIVCLSSGYFECLNIRNGACPSDQYLNARYIYDLIDNDPRKNETIIEVTFRNSFRSTVPCFQCAVRFNIPNQMQDLKLHLRN